MGLQLRGWMIGMDTDGVRQWLLIGKVDNVVIELWVFTCTVAGYPSRQNVGTLCSTSNAEMGICTREWVCRSFSLVIPIGKSNTRNYLHSLGIDLPILSWCGL